MFGSIFSLALSEFDIFGGIWQQFWKQSTLRVGEL